MYVTFTKYSDNHLTALKEFDLSRFSLTCAMLENTGQELCYSDENGRKWLKNVPNALTYMNAAEMRCIRSLKLRC